MEVFQTPRPDPKSITRWKNKWRDDVDRRIRVDNFTAAVKLLAESDIDPLFYQFVSKPYPETNTDGYHNDLHYIVFFKPEHEVFFKLHQGLA